MPDDYKSIIPKRVLRKIAHKLNNAFITPAYIYRLCSNSFGSIAIDSGLYVYTPYKYASDKQYLCTLDQFNAEPAGVKFISNVYDMSETKLPSIEDLGIIIKRNYFTLIPNSIMRDKEHGIDSYCLGLLSTLSVKDIDKWQDSFRAYEEFGSEPYLNITSCNENILAVETDYFSDLSDKEIYESYKSQIKEFVDWFITELRIDPRFEELSDEDIETFFNPDREGVIFHNKNIVNVVIASSKYTESDSTSTLGDPQHEYTVEDDEMIVIGFKYNGRVLFYTGGGKNIDHTTANYSFLTKYIAEELLRRGK